MCTIYLPFNNYALVCVGSFKKVPIKTAFKFVVLALQNADQCVG